MKKICVAIFIGILWAGSVAYAYYSGSNLGGYYPSYSGYLSYDPTREEVVRYVEGAKQYVNACNADIELIEMERNSAINRANDAINQWNMYH